MDNNKTKAPVKDKFDIFDPRNKGSKSKSNKVTDELKLIAKFISKNQTDKSYQSALRDLVGMSAKEINLLKKSIGPTDYRKGGMTVSVIDNRKNK